MSGKIVAKLGRANSSNEKADSSAAGLRPNAAIEQLEVSAFKVPTDAPESDGTYEWDSTTLVLVEAMAAGERSLGYSYADSATATLIRDHLKEIVIGSDAMSSNATWAAMSASVRNLGRAGIAAMAISAVDTSLWDLKAKLLGVPLATLFGQVRPHMPIYGSGGFTSYSTDRLCKQLSGWVSDGIPRVKMKIGRDARKDKQRVNAVRQAVGRDAELFVDANGAYSRKQALAQAAAFSESNISWFEEPVPSDDIVGLRLIRDRAPAGVEIAAGEYGYQIDDFRRLLEAGAVDVLQADATRCGGFTGFFQVASLCEAHHVPLSSHCAPALHLPVGCAVRPFRHAEYFYDHVRIEQMLFDGVAQPIHGAVGPDLSRAGLGLQLRRADAEKFRFL
jgi:L-alanine-DL-glutamate epimerase-like enolase superfamily enzyme